MIDNTPLQGTFRIALAASDGSTNTMTPMVPPVEVSRLLLLLFVAVGAVVSIASSPPLSSFAGGFAAGAGAVFVLSFLSDPRRAPRATDDEETP